MISAKDAACAGVDGLDQGKRVVIPGLPMQAAMLATRYIPHALKLPVVERVMRGR
jgi:short-subunit dehydrogenase